MGEVNPLNLPGIGTAQAVGHRQIGNVQPDAGRNVSTAGIPNTREWNAQPTMAVQLEATAVPEGVFTLDLSVPCEAPPLHNDRVPNYENEVEKPHHRVAAYMFAKGMTAKEIATAIDYTPGAVRNWLKLKWFQKIVTQLLHDSGGKDIIELFKAEQFNSLCTLLELRDNEKISATVRANVAMNILDRAGGKPVVRVETTAMTKSDDPVAEVARLEEEQRILRKN